MRMFLLQVTALLFTTLPLLAEDGFGPSVTTPRVTGAGTTEAYDAVVRIANAPWIERELARFAAALGRDPGPMRKALAEALYHASSLDAVDTARPAVFIWRKGPAPLQAIIPIRADNRREFIESFGVMGVGEPPLVRVGDRDGTVVFSQNHPEGLREYRLLIVDSVAYLARNADECRKLAGNSANLLPQMGNDSAPLSVTCTGTWLKANGLLTWSWSSRVPLQQWLPGSALMDAAQAAMLGQLSHATFEVRDGAANSARLMARLTAQPDSEFAAWIATQQNQVNRVNAQVGGPTTALKFSAHMAWQNKLEQIAHAVAPLLASQSGAAWTPALEESWIQAFVTAQRSADVLWMLDVPRSNSQVQTVILEQPRAEEQFQQFDVLTTGLSGQKPTPMTVAGYPATRRENKPVEGRQSLVQVMSATTRHFFMTDGWNLPAVDVLSSAEETVRRLQQVAPSAGESAIATLWCNLGRLVLLAPGIDTEVTIPDSIVQGSLRATAVNVVQFEMSIPLVSAAQALSHLPDRHAASVP